MKTRRSFLLSLTTLVVAAVVLVVPAIADELLGRITKVDPDDKKITVTEKGTDKEVEITVNDDTEWVSPKGTGKVDFEKIQKGLEKFKKGIPVKVTHEKKVASKIEVQAKKKAASKD